MKALAVSFVAWAVALAAASAQPVDFAQGRPRTLFPGTIDQRPAIDYRGGALADPVSQVQRELDLRTRLFKYRYSYMIYSPAFDALPAAARAAVFARPRATVTDRDTLEILDDTKPGWR